MIKLRVFSYKFSLRDAWKLRNVAFGLLRKRRAVLNTFSVLLSAFLRKPEVGGLPLILMLEPTSRCNLRCPMCPVHLHQPGRVRGDMPWEDFKRVIDELGETLMFLSLWNYGEPLLNPRISEMVRYAKGKSIGVALSTNAVLLDRARGIELIESGLDLLIVSFDGATKETYERYRKNASFEVTLKNIEAFVEEKRKRGRATPLLDLHFVVMKDNEREIPLFVDLAKNLGADMHRLKKVFYVEGREDEFLPLAKAYRVGSADAGAGRRHCHRLSFGTVINANGDVTACAADHALRHVLGNAFSPGGFAQVWNNEAYRSLRREAYKGLRNIDICRDCGVADFNTRTYANQ